MLTALEAVDALKDSRSKRGAVRTTGFSAVDDITGGFALGQVWIVTGTPGQGRSMLATQWALCLATRHGLDTYLVSPLDPAQIHAARLVAGAGRVSALRVWNQELREQDQPRFDHARAMLSEAKLLVYGPGHLSLLDAEIPGAALPEVLVVDDADLAAGAHSRRIASFASRGILVILTLPRHLVLTSGGVDPTWARVADFVIDIDRPDLLNSQSLRPGEADLHVVRNRWGPQRSIGVAFQGHYARFVDM